MKSRRKAVVLQYTRASSKELSHSMLHRTYIYNLYIEALKKQIHDINRKYEKINIKK